MGMYGKFKYSLLFYVLSELLLINAKYVLQNIYFNLEFPENLQDRKYKGNIKLHFNVDIETSPIIMDADVDEIENIAVTGTGLMQDIFKGYEYSRSQQLLYIYVHVSLKPGSFYNVEVQFNNKLRTDFTGFYLVQYLNEQNQTDFMMSSRLKPNYARRAFPCFDGPDSRALFHLTVTSNLNTSVIFNSAVESRDPLDYTFSKTIFSGTKLLPIYQFSLSVMRVKHVGISNVVTYRIYGRESCHTNFALNATYLLRLKTYSFITSSTMSKLMQILAVPTDAEVESGAWACGIFREDDITFNEMETTALEQVQIVIRIARALAHYYFGNHLTPESWTHIWMNDGFANWLAYKIISLVYPEWDIDQFFIIFEYQKGLYSDGLSSSLSIIPPINVAIEYIEDPDKNAILAAKSASFLRMLEEFNGEDYFKNVMKDYIRPGGVVQSSTFLKLFWEKVETHLDYDVLTDCLRQKGYSLVTINRNYSTGEVNLVQSTLSDENLRNRTWLPFNIVAGNHPNFTSAEGFFKSSPEFSSEFIEPESVSWTNDDWIHANYRQTAYYRINYDTENWKLLMNALIDDHTNIHVNNRAQLLDDSFKLAEFDILPYEISLNLSLYLENEREFAPWATANNFLATIELLLSDRPSVNLFHHYVRELINSSFAEMRLKESDKDSIILKATRAIISHWACRAWNQECFCEAQRLYQKYLKYDKLISPNIRKTVLCTGISVASRKDLDQTWRKMFRSQRKKERFESLYLLGCSQNEDFLDNWINNIINTEPPLDYYKHERTQVIPKIVDKGPIAVSAAIKALQVTDNQETLQRDMALIPALRSISQYIYSRSLEKLFYNLSESLLDKQFLPKQEYDTLIKQVEKNLNWVESHKDEVLEWLSAFNRSIPGYEDYWFDQPPVCETPPETRSCGCGCACEDSAVGNKPTYDIMFFVLTLMCLQHVVTI